MWEHVIKSFYLHDAIRIVVFKSFSSASSAYLVREEGQEVLEIYTAAMSRGWPGGLAMSSTHFRHSKLIVGDIRLHKRADEACGGAASEIIQCQIASPPHGWPVR